MLADSRLFIVGLIVLFLAACTGDGSSRKVNGEDEDTGGEVYELDAIDNFAIDVNYETDAFELSWDHHPEDNVMYQITRRWYFPGLNGPIYDNRTVVETNFYRDNDIRAGNFYQYEIVAQKMVDGLIKESPPVTRNTFIRADIQEQEVNADPYSLATNYFHAEWKTEDLVYFKYQGSANNIEYYPQFGDADSDCFRLWADAGQRVRIQVISGYRTSEPVARLKLYSYYESYDGSHNEVYLTSFDLNKSLIEFNFPTPPFSSHKMAVACVFMPSELSNYYHYSYELDIYIDKS